MAEESCNSCKHHNTEYCSVTRYPCWESKLDIEKCSDEIMELFDSSNNIYRHALRKILKYHFN